MFYVSLYSLESHLISWHFYVELGLQFDFTDILCHFITFVTLY